MYHFAMVLSCLLVLLMTQGIDDAVERAGLGDLARNVPSASIEIVNPNTSSPMIVSAPIANEF
jgi:hypothetical protein